MSDNKNKNHSKNSNHINQHHKKSYSFFTRMLLLSTSLLCIFSLGAGIVITWLSHRFEESRFLKNYDLASITLAEALNERFSGFLVLAGKIIVDGQCNPNLCSLLEASSYDAIPAALRNDCIGLMQNLCRDDRYLEGFYLYSPDMEQLYYYTRSRSYLSAADYVPDMEYLTPFEGTVLGTDSMEQLLLANIGQNSRSRHFGIAATLYRKASQPLGYLIPQYSIKEFENILSKFSLDSESAFLIQSESGQVIFNSNPDFDTALKNCYVSTITDELFHFNVTYYVPRLLLPKNIISGLIIILAVAVTIFSLSLYSFSSYLSHRNINRILEGMRHFDLNDLNYRLPMPSGRNEFTQITEGFNTMCEALQHNVERSYIYELQQKKSELYALQTSINPHFLYNTLEMIRGQILSAHPADASHMTLLLSKIYRIQTATNMFVTIAEEMEFCENLMLLYQYRFQNFDYEFEIDNEAERYALPKNSLQPLIENYFVHGIVSERSDNLFSMRASAFEKNGRKYVLLSVGNNGQPIDAEKLALLESKLSGSVYTDKDTTGFALTNINNRLRIVFKEDCRINICSGKDDMAFSVELIFPAMSVSRLTEQFS